MYEFIIEPTDTEKIFQIINISQVSHATLDLGGDKPLLKLIMSSGGDVTLDGSSAMNFLGDSLYLTSPLNSLINPPSEDDLKATFGDM